MSRKRTGAEFFSADQVLIVTEAAGAILLDPDGKDPGKLYVVRITGEDYDLRMAGVESYARKVALAFNADEIVATIRCLIDMLIDGGDEDRIIAYVRKDMGERK